MIKEYWNNKVTVTETPPPWVWKLCDRTVSVPEFIEKRAKDLMKMQNGSIYELVQITWQEYRAEIDRKLGSRLYEYKHGE